MLKQMSYYCPGMHGRESKQRIERRTFGDFLDSPGETKRVIVPIFQRRYCWEEVGKANTIHIQLCQLVLPTTSSN